VFDRLVFSDKVRQCHSIPLTGKAKRFSSETRPGETKTVDGVTYVLNDNHRWERAKEAIGAVSPNVGEDATLAEAFQQLRSDRHVRMRVAFERVDADLGLSAEQIDVVGDWGDGAEGSIISRYDGVRDFAELQYAMAWKGLLGNQKAVLSFLENDGPDAIYGTQVTGKIKSVRDAMDAVGIPDRSIYVGMGGRINLLVIDRGRKLNEAIKEFGEHFNATIKQQIGTSEFLGVDPTGTREAAREVYREYIAKYEGTFSDRPRASARRQALALAVGPEHATADDRGRSRVIGISRRKSESSDA
jgi:hypothetical protein